MLNVGCGAAGRVRIVKTNSETGAVTDEREFNNIWTDVGLAKLSAYRADFPTAIVYGGGVHDQPHGSATALKTKLGSSGVSFNYSYGTVKVVDGILTDSRTRSIVLPAKGAAWVLSELGLAYSDNTLATYTLTKNMLDAPEPVQVSAIEILTIYYTIQLSFPMELPPQSVEVVGLPPTTATFKFNPRGGNSFMYTSPALSNISAFSGVDPLKGQALAAYSGGKHTFSIAAANMVIAGIGSASNGANHVWVLDPPITKNNTQVLQIETSWSFTNTAPIETT